MHALIIEDEALIAMAIEEILRDCGFLTFDLAASVHEAIDHAKNTCPDLITADVELRPGSGIDAVNVICAGPDIPVIFVTGTPEKLASSVPQYPYILKPFRAEALMEAVRSAMA